MKNELKIEEYVTLLFSLIGRYESLLYTAIKNVLKIEEYVTLLFSLIGRYESLLYTVIKNE